MPQNYYCKNCTISLLEEFKDFRYLSRVTSDSKTFKKGGRIFYCKNCGLIQKISDQKWLKEISNIYNNYKTFSVSGFYDQVINDEVSKKLIPRCEVLLRNLKTLIDFKKIHNWLDYGCGRGAMLSSANNVCEKLYGYDLNKNNTKYLKKIKNFKELYCSAEELPSKKFQFISMIHSLEHFVNPYDDLITANKSLKDDGVLFIQVNDTRLNPFEILVADHLTHFEPNTLSSLLFSSGFEIIEINNCWVTKEISVLVKKQKSNFNQIKKFKPTHNLSKIKLQLNWLNKVVSKGKKISSIKTNFGLFGSSVASTWLANEIGTKVNFFVDEDPNRIGKMHMNKPIFSPESLKKDDLVYIGLIPPIAFKISKKLKKLNINYQLPPSY